MSKPIPHLRPVRARPWRLAALTLALAAAVSTAVAADPKASQYYEDALSRFEKKDYAGAVIQLKNVLKLDARNLSAQVLLGRSLLENGDVGPAEVAFGEALRLGVNRAEVVVPMARALVGQAKQQTLLSDPRFADADLPAAVRAELLLVKAGAATDTGDKRSALQAIEEARRLDPNNPASFLAEITLRSRAGELREAQAAADRALALAPNLPEALYLRGTVSHVQGDLRTAQSYYQKALALKPEHTEALVSRAGLLLDTGKLAEAERDVVALVKASPSDPRGAYLRALILERSGRGAEAKTALNAVTSLIDPVPIEFLRYRPQLLMLGGLSHFGLNQYEKAKPYLEALLRSQPTSPAAKLLAQIHVADRNPEKAVEVLDTYLRGNPGDTQAIMLAASAQMSLGRHARAAGMLQSAIEQSDQPALRGFLGMSLMGAGKTRAALPELEAAVKRDPGQVQGATALASLYLQSGQAAKAVAVAQELVKRHPKQPGLTFLLGAAQLRAGDLRNAKVTLEQAAALDSKFHAPVIELARLDLRNNNADGAAKRLNTVLAADPANVDALLLIGQIQLRRGRTDEARVWLEKAEAQSGSGQIEPGLRLVEFELANQRLDLARAAVKRLSEKSPEALRVLVMQARVQVASGDLQAAKSTLTRASGIAAFDTTALVEIATLQISAGHIEGAAHSLQKALSDAPGHFAANALLARVSLLQNDLAGAEQRARKLITSFPKRGAGYAVLGDIAVSRGQQALAVEHHRKAHTLDQSTATLLRLYQLTIDTDAAGAHRLAEQWLKGHPRDQAVLRANADGYARQGQLAEARTAYETLVKVYPQDADALNNLANVQILLKDSQALQTAERALSLKPQAPHILGTAGWAAFHAGQQDRALSLLREARLRDPQNVETRYFLGSVLAKAGRKAEARQELEAALASTTGFASTKDAERLLQSLR